MSDLTLYIVMGTTLDRAYTGTMTATGVYEIGRTLNPLERDRLVETYLDQTGGAPFTVVEVHPGEIGLVGS